MFVDDCPFMLQLQYDQHNNDVEQPAVPGVTPALGDLSLGEQKSQPHWRTDDDEQKYLDLQKEQ